MSACQWSPTRYIAPEHFGVNLTRNTPDGELCAKRHFDLCNAIDMTGLSVVLIEMVASNQISPHQADAFHAQAGGLLATLLSENARSFIGSPAQSTISEVRRFGITESASGDQSPVRSTQT